MDDEKIERALRAGPVDEPAYVPGSFRRGRSAWSLAMATSVIALTLLAGIAVGVGLGALRGNGDGVGAPDVQALAAQLKGRWVSQEITRQDWIDALNAIGHEVAAIDAYLAHDPIQASVRYELWFVGDHLQIFAAVDGAPFTSQSGGPYRLLADGALYYDDIGCFITATLDITGDRLSFDPISTTGCGADESLANAAFFNLVDYTRTTPAAGS
jgi:hypothetical protein